jgi:uncharacterized cupin superfamily protein
MYSIVPARLSSAGGELGGEKGEMTSKPPQMKKANTNEIPVVTWASPKGTFAGEGIEVTEALGGNPRSTDLLERFPFDVEILRIPPGKAPYLYHMHSAQWEFYHVISGTGVARDESGKTPIGPGDAFVYKPGEAHQLINDGTENLVLYVVADNPVGESTYFPDSNKWRVQVPERRSLRSEAIDYFDGEE